MTPRRAALLAINLPAGARIWAELGSDLAWNSETHMAANNADILAGANWQRGGGEGPKPPPVPRPGDESRAGDRMSRMTSKAEQYKARQQKRDGGA